MTITRACLLARITRSNYYAEHDRRQARSIDEELIISLVRQERSVQPRIGGRKLLIVLRPQLAEYGIKIGRDRFFRLLEKHGLLLDRIKGSAPKTTRFDQCLPTFFNHVKEMIVTGINQVWVCDITYIRTREGFIYLALIMDLYSRKIIGYHAGETLESVGCLEALKQAIKTLRPEDQVIHHSDRGCQYACHDYVSALQERGITVSMTEVAHCYENAHAERLNGILKQEYGLGCEHVSKAAAQACIKEAVYLYNERRLHTSLGYRVPSEFYAESAAKSAPPLKGKV